jgi:outer membrane receptor for ferrienterochelin and colicins
MMVFNEFIKARGMMNKIKLLLASVALVPLSQPVLAAEQVQVLETVKVQSSALSEKQKIQKKLLPISEEVPRTELITSKEIAASGATNITEAVTHRAGVDVQTECSICNAKAITLNNLPGRFTTILVDGIPIHSSASAVYGLEGTPTNILERVDIARGAGASLIAPEAIAGSVNLVTKAIDKDEGSLKTELGDDGSRKLDYFQGWAGKKKGQFLAINGQYRLHDSIDSNGDGISEFTGYDRKLAGIGLGLGDLAGWQTKLRIDMVDERRGGGATVLSNDWNAIKSSTTGNHFDWSKGVNASPVANGWFVPGTNTFKPYNSGMGGWSELIETKRIQHTLISEKTVGKDSYRFAGAYARHRQDSFYEGSVYNARQNQSYLEGRWKHLFKESALTSGVSYREEDLSSQGVTTNGTQVSNADAYSYKVPGVFAQYDFFAMGGDLEVNVSARHDEHNVFGGITSPRMLMAYTHNDDWTSRLSLGKGYRAPTSFFEQDHGVILEATNIDRTGLKAETARNISYNLTFDNSHAAFAKQTQFTTGIAWTEIDNMVMLDATGSSTRMLNAQDTITITTLDATLAHQVMPQLNLRVGVEHSRYDFHYQAVPSGGNASPFLFARPNLRGFLGADWESGAWTWRNRATWVAEMDLAKFNNSDENPVYNFDGSPKRRTSPAYWLVDTRLGYQLDSQWQIYAGINNLLDYKQPSVESPLLIDAAGDMNVTHIWGPMHGRHVFIGTELQF